MENNKENTIVCACGYELDTSKALKWHLTSSKAIKCPNPKCGQDMLRKGPITSEIGSDISTATKEADEILEQLRRLNLDERLLNELEEHFKRKNEIFHSFSILFN